MIEKFDNSEENIYAKIQEILSNLPANFSILEEEIDIDLQMEYFEFAKVHKDDLPKPEVLKRKENLFKEKTSLFEKKLLLCQLASTDDVSAYRCIEKYLENPDKELRSWAILALQESRMLLETTLLDENQVFISTGLGGKGNKLRYFIVLVYKEGYTVTESQKKLIKSEFEYILNKFNAEVEEIHYMDRFTSMKILIPIQVPVNEMLRKAVQEINQFGSFIHPTFILTNLKAFDEDEIIDFLKKHPLDKIS